MGTRIYEYGLLPPTELADKVWDQLRLAHRYRNTLVEIERNKRAAARQVMAGYPDIARIQGELEVLQTQREALVAQIAQIKQQLRTAARQETTAQRDALKALGLAQKAKREELKAAKQALESDPTAQAAFATVHATAHQQHLAARAACGVYWGTYLLVEAAAEASAKGVMDPSFVPWTGEGRLGVHIQGGSSTQDLTGGLHWRALVAPDHRPGRRAGTRRTFQLRIGTSERRDPIFASWPMIMHRPLPPEAVCKNVTVICRRVDSRRVEWRVQFALEFPEVQPDFNGGACALNLGWCKVPGGLRSGYVAGDDGHHREILLPQALIDRVSKAESIASIRAENLTNMRTALSAWLATHPWPVTQPPETRGLAERGAQISWWRSFSRFNALAAYWRTHRFSGDDDGYQILEAWRYRDQHLEQYEIGLVRGALRGRRELFRIAAAEMARRYALVVVDDLDLRTLQRSPRPEENRTEIQAVKYQQKLVAPSELRQSFISAFTRAGGVVKVSSENVTKQCHLCLHLNEWNREDAGRMHTCDGCGTSWDQDLNACHNLLRERHAAVVAIQAALAAKAAKNQPKGRWAKRKAKKAAQQSTVLETEDQTC